MVFPPRPRSTRDEPSIAPVGAAPRDAAIRPVLPRAAAPRPAAAKPTANDAGLEREATRFPPEHRHGVEPGSISLTAADRIIVSSSLAAGGEKRESTFSFFRALGLAVLFVLAAIGAYSLYHSIAPFLPWAG